MRKPALMRILLALASVATALAGADLIGPK
jgi:hypothetical protein